jgi:hypothetical protein
MSLTRDQILGSQDIVTEDVPVPEWGGTVRISTMSGKARDEFEQSLSGKDNMQNIRARLVAFCAVDDSGARIFKSSDVERLGEKSASALNRCVVVAQKLNLLTDTELEQTKGN